MSLQVCALPMSWRKLNVNYFCRDDILRIFGYLNTSEITRSVFPVCKIWKEIGCDPMLWKNLVINRMNELLSSRIKLQIINVVRNATLLKALTLGALGDVSGIMIRVSQCCRLLEYLELKLCFVKDDLSVQALVKGCPLVEHIFLDRTCGSTWNQLAGFTRLRIFRSCESDWYDDDFFDELSTNNRHLERLTLLDKCIDDKCIVPLLANVKYVLKALCINCSKLTAGTTFKMIMQCKGLEKLNLRDAWFIKDRHLEELKTLPVIEHIAICDAKFISSLALCKFITDVKSTKLSSLKFKACPKVDNTLEKFLMTHVDTVMYKVTSIDLNGCKNVSDCLVDLIIKGNPVLKILVLSSITSLRGTAFNTTDTSIAPSLKELNVYLCLRIFRCYLDTFGKNRSNLKIHYPTNTDFMPDFVD